jgi:hypothetical protein
MLQHCNNPGDTVGSGVQFVAHETPRNAISPSLLPLALMDGLEIVEKRSCLVRHQLVPPPCVHAAALV